MLNCPFMELLTIPRQDGGGDFAGALSDFLSGMKGKRIRCPKCAWQSRKESRWSCGEPCFCLWNTFDTAGRCPRCNRVWLHTCCLSCSQWSPHLEWYEQDEPSQ